MSVENFKISETETGPIIFTFALEVEKENLNKANQKYTINDATSIFQIINSEGKNTVPEVGNSTGIMVRKEGEEGLVTEFGANGKLLVDVSVDPKNIDGFTFDWERHKGHNEGVIRSIFKEEENENNEVIQMGEEEEKQRKDAEEASAAQNAAAEEEEKRKAAAAAAAAATAEEEEKRKAAEAAEARYPEKVFGNIPDEDKDKPHLLIVQNEAEPKTSSVYAYVPYDRDQKLIKLKINFKEVEEINNNIVTPQMSTEAPIFINNKESVFVTGINKDNFSKNFKEPTYFHFFNFQGELSEDKIDIAKSEINTKKINKIYTAS